MPPKNKGVKMDLSSFLNDDTLGGGWADDDVDFNSIEIPSTKGAFGSTGISSGHGQSHGHQGHGNSMDPAFGGHDGGRRDREFTEYPVPDAPPYRARLNNLPWDVTEESIGEYVESLIEESGAIQRVSAPRDMNDPSRLRGFAFVTFNAREQLEKALTFNGEEMAGRRVYIAVAAPEKEGGFGRSRGDDGPDLDWGSARGSQFARGSAEPRGDREFGRGGDREERPRREEPNLDWSSARGSAFTAREPRSDYTAREPRGDREFREPKPKREEPNLDWGVARGSAFNAREPRQEREPREPRGDGEFREAKPKREEPNLDWGSARGSAFVAREPRVEREPRERKPKKEEPEFDWSSARGSAMPASRPERTLRTNSNKKTAADEAEVWARGKELPARAAAAPSKKTQKESPAAAAVKPAVQKSAFAVLAGDDDEDDDEDDEEEELVEKTEKLSV